MRFRYRAPLLSVISGNEQHQLVTRLWSGNASPNRLTSTAVNRYHRPGQADVGHADAVHSRKPTTGLTQIPINRTQHFSSGLCRTGGKPSSCFEKATINCIRRNCSSSGSRTVNKHQQSALVMDQGQRQPELRESYERLCLGGTFDVPIHGGHKQLLAEALRLCTKSMTIGVTRGDMIKNKTLWELIAPVEVRINRLKEYLLAINGSIDYNIVPIDDPFGPAITDESLEAIVVSRETIRGGQKINEIRAQRSMKPLDMSTVDLVGECCKQSAHEEDKVSSSSMRMRKLGTVLREPAPRPGLPDSPYLVGLTGGIASGKSNIAAEIQRAGGELVGIVDCDQVAHEAYHPDSGTDCYAQIVARFGPLASDGLITQQDKLIDRKKLGALVFGNPQLRQDLNSIVWPATKKLVAERIEKFKSDGKKVVMVEAALLLEAGWHSDLHQVWVSIIDEKEAIERLRVRNGLSEPEAQRRIGSQMSNWERVQQANVVFCTKWEYEFTRQQVQKAWASLQQFL